MELDAGTVSASQRLRPMTEADLQQVLSWRNHPDIRRYMYTSHEIKSDEHRQWFAKATKNPAVHLLIFEQNNIAQGFVNLTNGRCAEVADWGFYIAPEGPKGIGRALGNCALTYAFEELNLHKVCGQALSFNQRSITFHEKLGFQREGLLRDQHCADGVFYDVLYFGLLASEWQLNIREKMSND